MRGYSRTESREYPIRPTRSTRMESTVAKTGRRMQVSGSVTSGSTAWLGWGVGLADGRRIGPAVRDAHHHALAKLCDSGGHDHVFRCEALQHLDPSLAPLPDLDALPRGLAVHHLVDVLVFAHGKERFL